MTNTTIQNWPTELWKPINTNVICRTIIGLQERLEDQNARIQICAFAAIACLVVAMGVFVVSPFGFVATMICIGAAVVGAVACVALAAHSFALKSKTQGLLTIFNNLLERKNLALKQFDDYVQRDKDGQMELEPQTRTILACLVPQFGSIFNKTEGNNSSPPERSIGHAMLLIACAHANTDGQPKDWSARTHTIKGWNDYLTTCQKFLADRCHGFYNCNPIEIINDLREKHPPRIAIPYIKSPGHGLLLTMLEWTSKFKAVDFNEKGELIGHQGNLENLKGWQTSVRRCQEWMQRKLAYGPLEEQLLKALLEAKTMRDFVSVLQKLSADDRQKLQDACATV